MLGGTGEIVRILERAHPDLVLITIPDAPREALDAIVGACADAGVACRFVRREIDLDPQGHPRGRRRVNIAAEGAAEETAQARPTFLDRVVSAYPVLTLYVVLSFLYCWQASGRASPFVFSDELEWAELSRGIAATGHAMLRLHQTSPGSIYAYLIAPAWWLGSTERGYEAVKYIGTLTMTASLIPAYLLARTLVPRPLALFAAAGTAMVPALIYGAMIIPEPLAYTYSTLCLYAGAGRLRPAVAGGSRCRSYSSWRRRPSARSWRCCSPRRRSRHSCTRRRAGAGDA